MNTRLTALAAAVLLLAADPAPSPSPSPSAAPSSPIVLPSVGGVLETILQKVTGDAIAPLGVDPSHVRGTVTFFKRFDLQLQMPLQTYKQIHLHQGTIINPRGASLASGQFVDVHGQVNADGSMNADEITILHR